MGWYREDDTGRGHEGWDAAVFAPGNRFSVGTGGGGALVRAFGPGGREGELEEGVDGRTAIGWCGVCECGWRSPLWARVGTEQEHAPAARRIWWPDIDQYGDAPDDVAAAIYAEWCEHLRHDPLDAVRTEARAVEEAQSRLTVAVHVAREAGKSWSEVGVAVGITRQSAHERWARPARPDRMFKVGDRVRLLVGQHVSYVDGDLEAEGEDAMMRFRVPGGEVCRITRVREYVTPFPYVVRRGDGREFGVAEHDLCRLAEGE